MSRKRRQRVLALVLSVVMILSASISALAAEVGQTEQPQMEITEGTQDPGLSVEEETTTPEEETQEEPQSSTIESNPEDNGNSFEQQPQTVTEQTQQSTPAENSSAAVVQPQETVSEAADLKQEFRDENDKVTQTVTAHVPEGAFQATADQISMEVERLNTADTDHVKSLMEEQIPEGFYLDGYEMYRIKFKVDGAVTQPAKAITITMSGNELEVADTKKAHVFYYDPADPENGADRDELVEVIQKDQLIKSLEESGQSTADIEDYDYAQIAVRDKNADSITVKGWESTIYGCYVEKEEVTEAIYEDDTVKVTVSADESGIIPNETTLQVVPIANKGETKDQYKEVEKKLQEKAKEDAYEIAGFLAYDISFVDKDGNEVEPNGEVRVSLEYKEATLPEGLTKKEAKKADVTMLHLEEDGKGEVKDVVDMAEKEQVEAIETTESQQVEKVAVKTESFSTFTITWTYGYNSYFTINVEYVDEDGNEITVKNAPTGPISLSGNQETVNLADYWRQADGYTQDEIRIEGNEVKSLRYGQQGSGWFATYYVKYIDSNDNEQNWLSSGINGAESGTISFVYKATGVKIEDHIIDTGTFDAVYLGDGEPTAYKWLKSDTENGNYTEVEKVNYKGGASNLSEDGSKLYPAYDEGARKWYKVEVTLSNGETVTSSPLQVPYYNELQNGSFENPTVLDGSNLQYGNDEYMEAGGVWQSTGEVYNAYYPKDVAIEIVREGNDNGGDSAYSWNHDAEDLWSNATPYGSQFAELNCQEAGALYQDVLTIEGTPLNYWLSHRARGNNRNTTEFDTMYLVIMPTADALENNLTTQAALENYLSDLNSNITFNDSGDRVSDSIMYNRDGILVVKVTSNDNSWHSISEIAGYIPTSSLTRFFFVAGGTATGDKTVGNFLDRVGFSQDLPDVEDDEFSLEVKKEFDGLDGASLDEVQEKLQFKISVQDNAGENLSEQEVEALLGTSVISDENWTEDPNGNITWAAANVKIAPDKSYTITITEENAELSGYELETKSSIVIRTDDQEGEPTENSGLVATVGGLTGKQIATVTFQNTYERSEKKNITFNKKWDDAGNQYGTRPGSLEVTLAASITVEENGQLTEKPLTADDLGVDLTRTLNSGNATDDPNTWQTVWQDVPVYYEYNGIPIKINYTVTEGSIDGGYVYEAANGGIAASGDGSNYKMTVSDNLTGPDANTAAVSAKAKALKASAKSARAGETEEPALGEPAHNKYIEYDASTGEYTLNLDVTGEKGEAKGADILFVIDTSGSMADSVGDWFSDSYLQTVKNLLTDDGGIIDQIFAGEDNVNSVAYVSFAGKSETKNSGWYSKNNYFQLESSINNLRATGGTNWTYAMQRASSVLSQRSNSDNEKVVIFLSDGEPTYTMSGGSQTGYGNYTINKYYEDAINEVTGSASLKNAQFYSVYLTSGTQSGMKKFSDGLVDGGVNSQLKDGTDLSKALDEILNQIIPTYENVTITDVLSEYVVFAEDPDISVKVQHADGSEDTLTAGSGYTLTQDEDSVAVTFTGEHQELEDGATYTISFKVKPSDAANNAYANSGYPHTGDPGTGSTSANREGFYSNDNDATNITYSIKGVEGSDSASYPKPVVQVTTHTLSYEKQWERPNDGSQPTEDVTLKVGYSDGTTNEITLEAGKDWKYTESVPVTKNIASVTEINTDPDYTPSYQITEGGTKVIVTNSYTKIKTEDITVKKVYDGSVTNRPEVQVALYGSTNDGNAVHLNTVELNNSNNWTHTWEGVVKQYGNDYNSYAVREVNIPAGFKSSISYEYGNDTTTATITNTYDPNCDDEVYYIANVLQTDRISVNKTWDDNNDVLGKRPENLDVTVSDGLGKTYTVMLSGTDGWHKEIQIPRVSGEKNYSANEQNLTDLNYELTDSSSYIYKNGADFYFVNSLISTSVTVKKNWNDGGIEDRPTSIQFKLQYKDSDGDWQDYGEYTMTEENMGVDDERWTMVIDNLPAEYEYQVVETGVYSGQVRVDTYTPKVDKNTTGGTTVFTITNTLKWSLKKTDMPEGEDAAKALAGAEFALKDSDDKIIAIGTSGEDGMVTWTAPNGGKVDLTALDGAYKLSETKAPSGYQILKTEWNLVFEKGFLKNASGDGDYNKYITRELNAENGVVVTLRNGKLYALPETGGPGIFLYMIGGTLLLMAGSLMIYINRRRGVLKG